METALFIFGLIGVIASLYAISAYRKEHVDNEMANYEPKSKGMGGINKTVFEAGKF